MRGHILTKGYDFAPKEHFKKISDERPDIVSSALIYDNVDQQSPFKAECMFSFEVESELRKNGDNDTADFVKVVRSWHNCCDKRGMTADYRVNMWYEMYMYLSKEVNFDRFPPDIGTHYKGMPVQTFEAMLQTCITRIQLYSHAFDGIYNTRAVSTLAAESFFSDITRLDKESHGYAKACNIPRILGKSVLLNYFKHKPDKGYELQPSTKGTYPIHLMDFDANNPYGNGFYRNHLFDYVDEHASHRCRQYDISTGLCPMRCVSGVRQHYRVDESKILPQARARMKKCDM